MANKFLQLVDLVRPDGKPTSGLVPVRSTDNICLSIDEQAAVYDAESFSHIDFIFFRRFEDGRSSQIAAYVVDNSDGRLNENALAELHQQVWLHGTAPLLYVSWPSRIDVLTCARGPDFWEDKNEKCQYNPAKSFNADALKTVGAIACELRKFSALRLADGTFWEEASNRALVDYTKAAHQLLIQAVVEADAELDGNSNPILRHLLLLMVLVKYLEDRSVFPNGWFGRFHKGARNFFDVLRGGDPQEVYRLLDFLERKFNGDVFSIPREGKQELTEKILNHFADLVEAKTINQQRYLWAQFSFEHLPVEIISHLYQRFVHSGQGAVYTPHFLASLLLDHAMPYNILTGKERVLDPACGSGVFLVGAFRRLINVWRSKNSWQRPDVDSLKEILKRSVFGVELDQNAVHLTAFSLCLAICDALQPDVIWRELKLDRLRQSNIFDSDFFTVIQDYHINNTGILNNRFDIIVGNPPFLSELTLTGKKIDKQAQRLDGSRGSLPDKQAAYLFLEQILATAKNDCRICLIQPSGFLYNQNAKSFRTALLRKFKIEAILDFTSIRKLYDGADPKTIAVLARPCSPQDDHHITHRTFRRTVSVHERICFELDHYDYHRVSQKVAETDSYVWRVNLLGGGRLLGISQRLRSMRTLADYVNQPGWDFGEGYIAARTGRRTPAEFLTGKPLLPAEALTDEGIDKSRIKTVEETLFRSAYTEKRYSAPLILIRKIESFPIDFLEEGFLAYRNKIVGIHAPLTDANKLRELYDNIVNKHNMYKFCCILHGLESIVVRATAYYKSDIEILPYPENNNDLDLTYWEEALSEDVTRYMADYVRIGQNSELLTNAASTTDMQQYSNTFLRLLGSVYDNLNTLEPIYLTGLICQPFYFGNKPSLTWLTGQVEDELQNLVYDDNLHSHLRTVRVLRFYSENVLLLVKPDRLRYWIRSTAIRDADETLIDLRRQGY